MMEFATQQQLPSVNAYQELVEAGGLMSYGPSYEDMHRRAAIYVDKTLKGAKPRAGVGAAGCCGRSSAGGLRITSST
jgi:ABC-type uncharacterized transport system substrate-binding protein